MSVERPDTETERAMPLMLMFAGGAFMFGAFGVAGTAISGYFLSAGLALTALGFFWVLKYPAYSLRTRPEQFQRLEG